MSERGSDVEVRIRPFTDQDAAAVHRWFNNPEATSSLMEVRDSFSLEDATGWVARAITNDSGDGEDRKWAIEVEATPSRSASPRSMASAASLRRSSGR